MRKAKQPSGGKLDDLANEWERSLSARDLSKRTAVISLGALDHLRGFLLAEGLSTDVADITREHMRTYLERGLAEVKASTVSVAYRVHRAFFKWCVAEGVLDRSPLCMADGALWWPRLQAHKEQIDAKLGPDLSWEPLDESKASRIAVYLENADPSDREAWPKYRVWAIEALGKFRAVLQPVVTSAGS